jgi:hypothetical protein
MESPACKAGDLILFDYRLVHRGLPNVRRERAVAYVVCGTGGALDGDNFPQMAIGDAHPMHVEMMSRWTDFDEADASEPQQNAQGVCAPEAERL